MQSPDLLDSPKNYAYFHMVEIKWLSGFVPLNIIKRQTISILGTATERVSLIFFFFVLLVYSIFHAKPKCIHLNYYNKKK